METYPTIIEKLTPLIFLIFLYCVAKYDAMRILKKQWIEDTEKRFSFTFRIMFVVGISQNIMQLIGYSLLFSATFDPLLNHLRGINKWHLGNNPIDKWNKKHFKIYKIERFAGIIIGIAIILIDYFNLI